MKANAKTILTAVLAGAAVLFLLAAALLLSGRGAPAPEPSPTPSAVLPTPTAVPDPAPSGTPEPAESVMPEVVDGLKVGAWPITQERRDYVDGSLELYIPAIGITRTIWDGTDAQTLNKGVGLYEYAQLPGEGNRNVSLAGHRNGLDKNGNITDHAPFYYVDTLGEGDYFYLTGGGRIYRYLYDDTWVVEPDDWSPIATTGYSCLTITSCEPIGISDHRIVVRARLDEIFDDSSDFDYLESIPLEGENV